MNGSPVNLAVWVDSDVACVKISGRAGCADSIGFRALILGLRDKGWRRFILDLADCQLMDSTFLGVLAGLGVRFSEETAGPRPPSTFTLLNPTPRISGLLDNLGVAEHFQVLTGGAVPAEKLTPLEASVGAADRAELQRTSLEAHQLLMKLNPANAPKFKDVCKFLEEDLKKLEANGQPAKPPPAGSPTAN